MTVTFLVDAQLPPKLAQFLEKQGHNAKHVSEIGLTDAPDTSLWELASRMGQTIVTKDADFAMRRRLALSGPPVVWIRLGNTSNRALIEFLGPVLSEIVSAIEAGETLVEVR